jgi:Protein of unknown function (DUF2510)/Phospholipase_D-nuclease N-terminal
MTGQIAGPSSFSLELVAFIIGVSMIVGAVDVIRQPGWAWKRAEESKVAYLVLVLLLPLVGLAMYVFSARPKVATIAASGRAASLPFERFGEDADHKQREEQREENRPFGTVATPVGLGSFGAPTVSEGQVLVATAPLDHAGSMEVSSTFFSTGGTATRIRPPIGLARSYRPRQRTSLADTDEVRPTEAEVRASVPEAQPTVPAGWKADPTGRHQFRYWDGFQWTENVADAGEQTRDPVAS